jgi:hypothetical protein
MEVKYLSLTILLVIGCPYIVEEGEVHSLWALLQEGALFEEVVFDLKRRKEIWRENSLGNICEG